MTDQAPEFQLGEPVGEYKAVTCLLKSTSAAVAKGDFVTLDPDSSTEPGPTVTASAKDDYAFGTVMKAGSPGTYIGVLTLGQVKVSIGGGTSGSADMDAGESVLPYNQSSVYSVTAKTGFARLTQAVACGDTGLIYIHGGVV
jgi:hypothetical protein